MVVKTIQINQQKPKKIMVPTSLSLEFMEAQKPRDREPQDQLCKKTLETAAASNKSPAVTGCLQNPPASTVPSLPQQQTSKRVGARELLKEGEGGGGGGGGGEQKGAEPPSTGVATMGSPTAAAAAASQAVELGPFTDLQKKLHRAERFGMPVQLSEEERRNSRAERFGTGSTLHGKSEEQKKKARAERFGLAGHSASDEEAKKKARLARFAQDSKPDNLEEEKRNARAIRFSQTKSSPPSQANGKSNSEQKTPTVD